MIVGNGKVIKIVMAMADYIVMKQKNKLVPIVSFMNLLRI